MTSNNLSYQCDFFEGCLEIVITGRSSCKLLELRDDSKAFDEDLWIYCNPTKSSPQDRDICPYMSNNGTQI